MKAIIIGATGASGKDLVHVLLQDPAYTAVVVFVRRSTGCTHPKLVEFVTDLRDPDLLSEHFRGDVWFSCLGTTLKAAGSKEKQWQIDYDLPVRCAEIAKNNGVRSTVLLSAYGASASSKVFYPSMKGKLEEKIGTIGFEQYIIFRPGMLRRDGTDRLAERVINAALGFFNGLGLLKKWRPMPTALLAEKLAKAPKVLGNGKHVVELADIFGF